MHLSDPEGIEQKKQYGNRSSKYRKLGVNMTCRDFAVHPTASEPGVRSAGAQLVTGHVWEVSLGGNGSLLGRFYLGCGQEDTSPC